MGEGLLRQRRNLIITSVLLWLMKYGGISFEKISFVGFDLKFKNPHALTAAIWIAFFYFLYRFYQYFSDEGVGNLNKVFHQAFEKKCKPVICGIVEKQYPNNQYMTYPYSYANLKMKGGIMNGESLDGVAEDGSSIRTSFEIPISRSMLWKPIYFAITDSIFRNSVVTDYLLPFFLAGVVIYYCGSNNWDGSFLRLFNVA